MNGILNGTLQSIELGERTEIAGTRAECEWDIEWDIAAYRTSQSGSFALLYMHFFGSPWEYLVVTVVTYCHRMGVSTWVSLLSVHTGEVGATVIISGGGPVATEYV